MFCAPMGAMMAPANCMHLSATLVFLREGTRLHPKVWMIEQCVDCHAELDRLKLSKDYAVSTRRPDK
jgi:hypothetical protein